MADKSGARLNGMDVMTGPAPEGWQHGTALRGGPRAGSLQTKHNQVTTADFNPDQVRQLYERYCWQRMGIFVWRTLTAGRDFSYNTRLVLKYPHALVHAAKEAMGASR